MPSTTTITRTINVDPEFAAQYRRARALAGDTFVDKVIEVADATLAGEHDPNAARLAIRAYQWTAGKLNSAEYGDNTRVDVSITHDVVEHAPDWMQRRLAPNPPPQTIEADAEVIDADTTPEPTNTSSGLVTSIEAAAADKVTPKGA